MSDKVVQGPDINLYPEDTERVVKTYIRRNGIPTDVTDFEFTAVLLNGETEIASVPVTIMDGPSGELECVLDEALIAQLTGRYSTWRLTDHTDLKRPFLQRRIVRQR